MLLHQSLLGETSRKLSNSLINSDTDILSHTLCTILSYSVVDGEHEDQSKEQLNHENDPNADGSNHGVQDDHLTAVLRVHGPECFPEPSGPVLHIKHRTECQGVDDLSW